MRGLEARAGDGPRPWRSASSRVGSGSTTVTRAAPSASASAGRNPPPAPISSTRAWGTSWYGKRVQRGPGVADIHRPRPRQRGDAVAVAIQAETARRAGQPEHGGVVGDVGVHPLGEVVEQHVVAARRQAFGQHLRARRVQRGIDRLEVVEPCLVVAQQQRLGRDQRQQRGEHGGPAPARHERHGQHQRRQQRGDQEERRHHEHQRQHQGGAGAGAGQVEGVDQAGAPRVQHEAQADEQPGQGEERQQAGVIEADIAELRQPGRRILQLQRIERIDGGQVVAQRAGGDQQRPAARPAAGCPAGPARRATAPAPRRTARTPP